MRLLFDSTTTLRWAFEQPVGTVRVERVALSGLGQHFRDEDIGFVNCDQRRFVHISASERALIERLRAEPGRRLEHERHEPAASPRASRSGHRAFWAGCAG